MKSKSKAPLVILGFDAGDPQMLRAWQEEGRLSTLGSIVTKGCWSETSGRELLFEHGVWQIIFSGVSRAQSGHYYLRQLVPGSYDLKLVNARHIDARPFWNRLVGGEETVFIADVPDVLPEPELNGLQFSNWAIHRGWRSRDPAELPTAHPAGLLRRMTKLAGPPELILENPNATPEQDRAIFRRLLARVRRKGLLCRTLIGKQQPDLAVVVFCESHSAGHQFWKYRKSSDQPNDRFGELSNATRTIYEAIDEEMGLLLRQLPADSNVVVLSSVGLRDHYPTGRLLESFCRTLGYQVPAGNGAKPSSFQPLSMLRQRIPEAWRIGLSRQFSRETRERLLASQFRSSTDWTRTTAFVIPSIYTGFIQVNLRGREPEGIVEPGPEYESILHRLESDLAQLIDPITGQRAVERVVRTNEVFGPDAPSRMPDLIVHWQPAAHFVSRVIHPKGELVQVPSEFNRDSDHYERGFFAAAGPSIINAGRVPDIDVLDLAPTFLSLLGRSPAPWMSGQALESVVQRQAADSLV